MKTLFLTALLIAVGLGVAHAGNPPDIYFNNFEFPDMRVCFGASDGTCFQDPGHTISGEVVMSNGELSPFPSNGGICHGAVGTGVCTGITVIKAPSNCQIVNEPANCLGGWCGKCTWGSNSFTGADLTFWSGYLPGNIPNGCSAQLTCFTDNVYFRYKIKWQQNVSMVPSSGASVCQGKLLYMRSTIRNTDNPTVIISFRQNFPPAFVNVENTQVGAGGSFNINPLDGQWHTLEVNLNRPAGLVNVWWDENQVVNNLISPITPVNSPVDTNQWGMFMDGAPPTDNCTPNSASGFWIDELQVGSQRLGGSVVTIPGTPANLTVN